MGIDLGFSVDVGASYHVPYYNDRQYLVLGPQASGYLASYNWMSAMLYVMKATVYAEIVGAKFTPRLKFMFDDVSYNDFCLQMGADAAATEANIYIELDVYDCNFGVVGSTLWILSLFDIGPGTTYGTAQDCQWKNYKFDTPVVHIGPDTLGIPYFSYSLDTEEECLSSLISMPSNQ